MLNNSNDKSSELTHLVGEDANASTIKAKATSIATSAAATVAHCICPCLFLPFVAGFFSDTRRQGPASTDDAQSSLNSIDLNVNSNP